MNDKIIDLQAKREEKANQWWNSWLLEASQDPLRINSVVHGFKDGDGRTHLQVYMLACVLFKHMPEEIREAALELLDLTYGQGSGAVFFGTYQAWAEQEEAFEEDASAVPLLDGADTANKIIAYAEDGTALIIGYFMRIEQEEDGL